MDVWGEIGRIEIPPPPKTSIVRVRDTVEYDPRAMHHGTESLWTYLYRFSDQRMRQWLAQEYPNHALVSLTRVQSYDKDHLSAVPQPYHRHHRTEIIEYDAELAAL